MSRKEIKNRSKSQLGNNIFSETWMMLLLVYLIYVLLMQAAMVVPIVGFIIISGPLAYGINYIFLNNIRKNEKIDIGNLFKGFSDDFSETLLLGLMTTIFVFLWSLLFIVPGIVKTYSYSMAYFIKIDNKNYDWSQCLNESKRIMKGHKGELFIQDLSFIGWFIVGTLCLGVGTLWVYPYLYTARANFYETIKG